MDNRADTGWIVSDVQTGKNHFCNTRNGITFRVDKEEYLHGGWGFGLANIHEDDAGRIVSDFQINLEKETINHLSMITSVGKQYSDTKEKQRIHPYPKCDQRSWARLKPTSEISHLFFFTLATKQTGGKTLQPILRIFKMIRLKLLMVNRTSIWSFYNHYDKIKLTKICWWITGLKWKGTWSIDFNVRRIILRKNRTETTCQCTYHSNS